MIKIIINKEYNIDLFKIIYHMNLYIISLFNCVFELFIIFYKTPIPIILLKFKNIISLIIRII